MGVVNRSTRDKSKKSIAAIAREVKDIQDAEEERDSLFDDEEEEEEEESLLQTDEEIEEELKGLDFDIFIDVGEKRAKRGDVVRYTIYQNGQMIATSLHPYSWEKLQKEHGGGHYKVQARSTMTGQFIKQQSKQVAEAKKSPESESEKSNGRFFELLDNMNKTLAEQQRASDEKARMERIEFQRKLEKMQEQQKEENKENQNTMLTMLTALMSQPKDNGLKEMMAMMQAQGQQQMQMMMAMMKGNEKQDNSTDLMTLMMQMNNNTMQMIKEMNESNSRAFDKISDRIEKAKGGDDSFSGMKLVELFQTAQGQGFEQMKLLNELAEKKAAEKGDGGDEDESVTKSLIKTLPGVLTNLAQISAANKQAPTQSLPQSYAPRPVAAPNPARAKRPEAQGKNAAAKRSSEGGRASNGKTPSGASLGLPRPKLLSGGNQAAPKEASHTAKKGGKIDEAAKKQALELLLPVVGQCLMESKKPEESGLVACQVIESKGLVPSEVAAAFTPEELINIAAGYGIKESDYSGIETWLKGFYDTISNQGQQEAAANH